jgi:hypothetical protein
VRENREEPEERGQTRDDTKGGKLGRENIGEKRNDERGGVKGKKREDIGNRVQEKEERKEITTGEKAEVCLSVSLLSPSLSPSEVLQIFVPLSCSSLKIFMSPLYPYSLTLFVRLSVVSHFLSLL